MLPEFLMWRLCGEKVHEYTNATTTGLVNARSKQYDDEITHLNKTDISPCKLRHNGYFI
jgi:sugar (pentulose or hexulose) kinase